MGTTSNLLRKQVTSELKKRKLITFTIILLTFIYVFISMIFGDMGLLRYKRLYNTKIDLEKQIKEIVKENEELKTQIKLLNEDPFYKEKFARENFGLAQPDEYIFLYDR